MSVLFICLSYFTCKEFSRVSPGLAIAASIEVVVVPMFDPSVRGYALSRLMTPIPVEVWLGLGIEAIP